MKLKEITLAVLIASSLGCSSKTPLIPDRATAEQIREKINEYMQHAPQPKVEEKRDTSYFADTTLFSVDSLGDMEYFNYTAADTTTTLFGKKHKYSFDLFHDFDNIVYDSFYFESNPYFRGEQREKDAEDLSEKLIGDYLKTWRDVLVDNGKDNFYYRIDEPLFRSSAVEDEDKKEKEVKGLHLDYDHSFRFEKGLSIWKFDVHDGKYVVFKNQMRYSALDGDISFHGRAVLQGAEDISFFYSANFPTFDMIKDHDPLEFTTGIDISGSRRSNFRIEGGYNNQYDKHFRISYIRYY